MQVLTMAPPSPQVRLATWQRRAALAEEQATTLAEQVQQWAGSAAELEIERALLREAVSDADALAAAAVETIEALKAELAAAYRGAVRAQSELKCLSERMEAAAAEKAALAEATAEAAAAWDGEKRQLFEAFDEKHRKLLEAFDEKQRLHQTERSMLRVAVLEAEEETERALSPLSAARQAAKTAEARAAKAERRAAAAKEELRIGLSPLSKARRAAAAAGVLDDNVNKTLFTTANEIIEGHLQQARLDIGSLSPPTRRRASSSSSAFPLPPPSRRRASSSSPPPRRKSGTAARESRAESRAAHEAAASGILEAKQELDGALAAVQHLLDGADLEKSEAAAERAAWRTEACAERATWRTALASAEAEAAGTAAALQCARAEAARAGVERMRSSLAEQAERAVVGATLGAALRDADRLVTAAERKLGDETAHRALMASSDDLL